MYTKAVQNKIRSLAFAKARRTGFNIDWEELFVEGEYAVAANLARFDPSKGVPFDVWATQRAHWAMVDYQRRMDPMSRRDRHGTNKRAPIHRSVVHTDAQPKEFLDFHLGGEAPDRSHEEQEVLLRAVDRLDPAERRLLQQYYFEDRTQGDIARDEGVTNAAISHRLKAVLAKLRRCYRQAA